MMTYFSVFAGLSLIMR